MHHKAVHVSHNITVKPWAGASSSVTTLTFWNARSGKLKETTSETLCSVGVEDVEVHIFRMLKLSAKETKMSIADNRPIGKDYTGTTVSATGKRRKSHRKYIKATEATAGYRSQVMS